MEFYGNFWYHIENINKVATRKDISKKNDKEQATHTTVASALRNLTPSSDLHGT